MAPEVLRAVTGADLPSEKAILEHYGLHRLAGKNYPGMIARPGSRVPGEVISGVKREHLRLLNLYEGDEYVLENVEVTVVAGANMGSVREAVAYVLKGRHVGKMNPEEGWDYREFRRLHLDECVRRIRNGSAMGGASEE